MFRMTSVVLTSAAFATALALSPASAQTTTPPVRGTIESVDGSIVTVKTDKGDEKVTLAPNVAVYTIGKAQLSDIKKGDFVGVGATPQPDGSQKAIRVTIFSEAQRGTGEGFRPWDRPNTTMTNATVDNKVESVDGQVLTVKYKDGEKKIIVGPDATILSYQTGSKADLKPGANVNIPATQKDGHLEAARVNVGRGDYKP